MHHTASHDHHHQNNEHDHIGHDHHEHHHHAVKNLIKNRDIFGHRVQFNFNQKDTSFKTIAGGLFSIVFKFFFFSFSLF